MKGYACPTCGGLVVVMAAFCEVLIGDDGHPEIVRQSLEWNSEAPARCYAVCGWRGFASDAELCPEAHK